MGNENRPHASRAEIVRFGVGVAGVAGAAWFFLTTEDVLLADLWLVAFLVAGEVGGRVAAKWIDHDQDRRGSGELAKRSTVYSIEHCSAHACAPTPLKPRIPAADI